MISHLEAALQRRAPMQTQVLRLFDGAGDGIPGLLIDRLDSAIIIRLHEGSKADSLFSPEESLPILSALPGIETITMWSQTGDAVETTRQGARDLFGPPPQAVAIEENGLRFEARPLTTPSAGFFTDMRDIRAELKASSAGKRMLNTFCFTGSLGIAAFAGGAAEVVQLDISKSALTWAKLNFEANAGKGSGTMRFIPDDTSTFFEREVRRHAKGGAGYDTIIIDPPAFGSSKGNRFVQEDALPPMLLSAFSILNKGGEILLTSNRTVVTPRGLERVVREAAASARVAIRSCAPILPPKADFTARDSDSNAMRGVKVSL